VSILFLVVLALHMGYSFLLNRQDNPLLHRRLIVGTFLTQTPLFALSCYYGVQEGVFSRALLSPFYIGLGLVCGHVIFVVSLLITHRSLRDTSTHLVDFGSVWNFAMGSPLVLSRFVSVAVAEEMIWRVAAQSILIRITGSAAAGVVLVGLAFAVVHKHFFRNSMLVSAEFVGFSLLIGGLYYWTGSLIFVIVIHAVRDIEISFLEYVIKLEELGDHDLATQHIEKSLMPSRPGKT
jgi:membrane protease YdiL (CAAX protease family)